MEQTFRRLLPRRSTSPLANGNDNDRERSTSSASNGVATSSASGRRASKSVRAACEACRRQKCKCDGKRPSCSHCLRQRAECTYITDSGETRFSALRRRYSLREGELGKLNKLIQHIRIGSPEEVDRIITHIRSCDDSIEAYSSYFSSGDSLSRTTETETETWTTPGLRIDSQLDPVSEAWPALGNPVQVDALPWTDVAPDHVVSHLISQYFILERPILLPTIHFQSFIDEMNKGDAASGIYCSDLLVNAICAQQCFLSQEYTQGSVASRDMGRKFLAECYRLLQLRTGRLNLPTAQALTLIYQAELARDVFQHPIEHVTTGSK